MNSAFIFLCQFLQTILSMESKCPKQIKTNKQDNKQPSQDQKKPQKLTSQTKTRMHFEEIKVALNFIRPIFGILTEDTETLLVFKSVF